MKTTYHSRANRYTLHILLFLPVFALFAMTACSYSGKSVNLMDTAESIMNSRPDSALVLLDSVADSDLHGRKQKARCALLKSIVLDKNYIDTTTFDVLQPAIDYYPKNGTPDEKLKTFYYQGRIYQNANEDDLAMQAWLRGSEVEGITDSLILAHLLVAKGILYHKQYKIDEYVKCNLRAAEIYGALGRHKMEVKSYCYAIDGTVILQDKRKADSIVMICRRITTTHPELSEFLQGRILNYIVKYSTQSEILKTIEMYNPDSIPSNLKLILAKGYSKIGNAEKALQYLDSLEIPSDNINDSLSYLAIRATVMENFGIIHESNETWKRYAYLISKSDYELFSNELLFSEKKHNMEMAMLMERQKRWNIIWASTSVGLILMIILIIVFFKYQITAARKKMAEQQLDNLRLELGQLENERDRLEALLQERPDMTPEMMNVVYQRLDMLNTLLAKEIASNDSYARDLIESIRKDRAGFLDSTRMAFSISYPRFMQYLQSHGLTEEEINYACLYAMGLRGKEIGEYIQLKRHYVMGSGIRKKLGIDEHETNLGPYIRKLLKDL